MNVKKFFCIFLLISNIFLAALAQNISTQYSKFKSTCLLSTYNLDYKQHHRTIAIINGEAYIDDALVKAEENNVALTFYGRVDGLLMQIKYNKIDPIDGSKMYIEGSAGQAICSVYFPSDSGVSTIPLPAYSPNSSSGGCGSRGGAGYRRSDGRCAGWNDR